MLTASYSETLRIIFFFPEAAYFGQQWPNARRSRSSLGKQENLDSSLIVRMHLNSIRVSKRAKRSNRCELS